MYSSVLKPVFLIVTITTVSTELFYMDDKSPLVPLLSSQFHACFYKSRAVVNLIEIKRIKRSQKHFRPAVCPSVSILCYSSVRSIGYDQIFISFSCI